MATAVHGNQFPILCGVEHSAGPNLVISESAAVEQTKNQTAFSVNSSLFGGNCRVLAVPSGLDTEGEMVPAASDVSSR
jgi:hypothetical protein